MITYKSKSIYFDIENGEEITKKNAKQNYHILNTTKHANKKDESQARGYEYIEITIEWWRECKRKNQLRLFR